MTGPLSTDEIFGRCAARRRRVADVIESLTDEQLATASLCDGWTVRTVAAHLTVPLVVPRWRVGLAVARARGSFHRANDALSRQLATQPVSDTVAALREHATSRFTPPLHGAGAPLTDLCAHTADITAPLGMPLDIEPAEAVTCLDFLHGFSMFFVAPGTIGRVRLVASDVDRTWGDGPDVTGTAAELLLALLGRAPFVAAVTGPGAERLRGRT